MSEAKLQQVMNTLLVMLDEKCTELEKQGKTGSPYWKRLRERKRIVQVILENYHKPWKEIWESFDGEFWKKEVSP